MSTERELNETVTDTAPAVLARREGPVLVLTLNRPAALHALNSDLMGRVAAHLDAAECDDSVRAVVVTGSGRAFCAGADLVEVAGVTLADGLSADGFPGPMFATLATFPKPVVAAVNGLALGGGCELALACDIVIAEPASRFGLPEVTLGLIPAGGGTQRLIAAVGKSRAMQMILSGAAITADEALAAGLVSEIAAEGGSFDRAVEIAARISANAPVAVQLAKEAVLASAHPNMAGGLDNELRSFLLLLGTQDAREGLSAFTEKRRPTYTGR